MSAPDLNQRLGEFTKNLVSESVSWVDYPNQKASQIYSDENQAKDIERIITTTLKLEKKHSWHESKQIWSRDMSGYIQPSCFYQSFK